MANVVETTPNSNTVTVTEQNRTVSVTSTSTNTVSVNNSVVPSGVGGTAANVTFTATGSITSTNLQSALEELARQQYSQESQPTDVEEGSFWYKTDTDILYVYQEVSPGTFEWRPVILSTDENEVIIDAGSY